MYQAITVDSLRGYDSTGIMAMEKHENGGIDIYKEVLPGYNFVDTRGYRTISNNLMDYKFVIAHNRWATRGSVNFDNTHPFKHGDIAMVHNGTLTSRRTLPEGRKFGTDSEDVAYSMSKHDLKAVIEKVYGAFAFAVLDEVNQSLTLARNDQRPLHFAINEKDGYGIIASESGMLTWLAERNSLELDTIYEVAAGNIVTFTDNLSFDVGTFEEYKPPAPSTNGTYTTPSKLAKEYGLDFGDKVKIYIEGFNEYPGSNIKLGYYYGIYESANAAEYAEVEVHGCVEGDLSPDVTYNATVRGFRVSNYSGYEVLILNVSHESCTPVVTPAADVDNAEQLYKGPGGTLLSEAQFRAAVSNGCCSCRNEIGLKEAPLVEWVDISPMCPDCVDLTLMED